jgi:hypothetical protein
MIHYCQLESPCQKFTANAGTFARTNYLVGASDRVKEGAFEWCTSDSPANVSSLIKWTTGQPDNLNKAEHCANIAASSGTVPDNILLSDLSCDTKKMKYLCEVRLCSMINNCVKL